MTTIIHGDNGIVFPDATTQGTALTTGNQTFTGVKTFASVPICTAVPVFRAYTATAQNVTNASPTLTFELESLDTASCFNTSTSRFTPNVAGYYFFHLAMGATSVAANAYVEAWITKNASISAHAQICNTGVSANQQVHASGIIFMNGTTDYVFGSCYTNGASSALNLNANITFFEGFLVARSA